MPIACLLAAPIPAQTTGAAPNPFPRALLGQEIAHRWSGAGLPAKWQTQNDARWPSPSGSILESTGQDPILVSPPCELPPTATIQIRMRTRASGPAQIFWLAPGQFDPTEDFSTRFDIRNDGEWHEYEVLCPKDVRLRGFRLDPANGPGEIEIEFIRAGTTTLHPLEIVEAQVSSAQVRLQVTNHSEAARAVSLGGRSQTIPPGSTVAVVEERAGDSGDAPFEMLEIALASPGLPPIIRNTVVHHPRAAAEWIHLRQGRTTLDVAPDGSGARLLRNGRPVATIAPLVWDREQLPKLELVGQPTPESVTFRGTAVQHLKLSLVQGEVRYVLRAATEMEGPVVRALGRLEQGLLPGVEHLGKNESSSAAIDIHGPEHIRHTPDRRHVTLPFMAFVTDRASLSMLWWQMLPQPVFATPNFFEGTADHRMALRGTQLNALIRIGPSYAEGGRLADTILWAVKKNGGAPKPPPAPRSHQEQLDFCLASLNESLLRGTNGGWYHALVPNDRSIPETPRHFADHLSTVYRLTGKLPDFPGIVPGGAHLDNDTIYFVSGQAQKWLDRQRRQVASLMRAQQPDGSYRYGGEFRAGHFEDTSSGQCGLPASRLLQFAKYTGDQEALRAGIKTLEFMKRFRTPRGAQVWECPLHAPDIMASAHLARAYTLGFELTDNDEYLEHAVRWALTGIPFVYQWGDRPIMRYATIATLCATHYNAPVWIGRPVQWCGLVYADALLDLAKHDRTLPWRKLAEGILVAGEQQQYTEGPSKGLLADSLLLDQQKLLPFDINPCALVSLRLRIHDQPAGLSFARLHNQRVVAPFPCRIDEDAVVIDAPEGTTYQILIDGERIVEIQSRGTDRLSLDNL